MYDRYYAEPERYPAQVKMYDDIDERCELLYRAGGPYYDHSDFAVYNIYLAIKGMLSHGDDAVTGSTVSVYRVPGSPLEYEDISLEYTGEETPILDAEHNTVSVLVHGKDPAKQYLNTNRFKISYHLYDLEGNMVVFEGARTDFGSFVDQLAIGVKVDTAAVPEKGVYRMEITAVQENVVWLADRGLESIWLDVEIR